MVFLDRVKRTFQKQDPQQLKRECCWLLARMGQYRRKILLIGLLGIVGTVLGLASNVASKYLIDAVTGSGADLLKRSAVLTAVLVVGSLILQAVSSRISASVHIHIRNEIQHRTYGRILRAGWEALEPYRSGDLLHRLTADVNTVADGIIGFLPNLLISLIRCVGALGIILYYDPVMALIALLGVPATLILSRVMLGEMRRHNQEMKDLTGEVMSFQEDSFRNLTSIKAFSVADHFETEMHRLQGIYANAFLSYNAMQIGISTLLSLGSMAVTAACFGWCIYQLWNGRITYGSLTLFLQLATTLRGSLSSLVSLVRQVISLTTSAGRIMSMEELPEEVQEIPQGLQEESALSIRIEKASFHYQNGDTVLDTFDFTAQYGDVIAVIGPSGEGKTTLLRLLLGLVEPCEGQAVLVGSSGNRYPISAGTRNAFSYVPQGNSVFAGTIAENLRLINPQASEEDLVRALKTACAWDFVSQLPGGIHHTLGAGGRGISEGQAQRIAIARALLRKAPVLLLDEATSGLDAATERQLLQNLQQEDVLRTCILVTHRPESARFCNRTYEIHRRQVTEVTDGI